MRIFHASDLHFHTPWFEYIVAKQNAFDAVCLTGDFVQSSIDTPIKEQIRYIQDFFRQIKVPLLVCSGNHDIDDCQDDTWLSALDTVYSDTNKVSIKGIRFGCVPFMAPDFLDYEDCDVLLYHLPPAKTATSIHKDNNEDWGDEELRRLINKGLLAPKTILCGHMHHPCATIDVLKNTTIYNSGVDKSATVPNYHSITIK